MRRFIPIATAALLAPVACDDSPTNVVNEPSPEAVLSTFVSMAAGPDGIAPCPEGGEIARAAEHSTVIDGGTITTTFHATMEHRACAVRFEQLVITSDGTMTIDGIDRREYDGVGPGAIIESSTHQTGSMRVRTNEGYDRTCAMDITVTADPATNTRRLTGSVCGTEIDFELTLP
jgi:hypothetical protein